MGKEWIPAKPTVELRAPRGSRPPVRASRIRREPVQPVKEVVPRSPEREAQVALIGIALFALALTLLSIGFGAVTN